MFLYSRNRSAMRPCIFWNDAFGGSAPILVACVSGYVSRSRGRGREADMITLSASTSIDDDAARFIGDGLDNYNVEHAGPYNEEDLWIVGRSGDGAVVGGLKGVSEYSWLFVAWLWIDAEYRKLGLGAQLLGKAEEISRQRGCLASISFHLLSRPRSSTNGRDMRRLGVSTISRRGIPASG